LNEQFATFGKWTAKGILAMAFVVIIWLWVTARGGDAGKLISAPETSFHP